MLQKQPLQFRAAPVISFNRHRLAFLSPHVCYAAGIESILRLFTDRKCTQFLRFISAISSFF